MVTYRTQIAVWQGMNDVAQLGYHYRALADRYRRYHHAIRFLLIAAAMGGIVALLAALPQTVQLAACGAVVLAAAWDLAADYARKAAVLRAVGSECSSLEIEWGELRAAIDREDADDAGIRRENLELARRLDRATARVVDAGVWGAPASTGNT